MRKHCFTLAAAALALAGLPSAHAQLAVGQDFGERIEVNTVSVDVAVTGKDGRPVTGLQKKDFELWEDGRRVEIVNFDTAGHPAPAAQAAQAAPKGSAEAASAEGPPAEAASWVVYVDDVFIQPAHRARVLAQLREFLTGRLAPGDQILVATYDQGLHIHLPFSRDRRSLGWALDQIERSPARGSDWDRARLQALSEIVSFEEMEHAADEKRKPGPSAHKVERDRDGGNDPLSGSSGVGGGCSQEAAQAVRAYADALRHGVRDSVEAMKALVNSLSGLPGRKAVLHVSDGIPLNAGEELFQVLTEICGEGSALDTHYHSSQSALEAQSFGTAQDWTALAAHANAQRVTLYEIQAGGPDSLGAAADLGPREEALASPTVASVESQNRQQPLALLAKETGGRALFWSTDLRDDLARIQEDLTTSYSLGFNPSHNGDGREHRLEVKVKRPGVTVRYRQSYRDKPPLERTVDRTLASLFYSYEDNPLDIQMEVGEAVPAEAGAWSVPVRLRIPLFKLGLRTLEQTYEGRLRLLVAVRGADGGNAPLRQVEIPIRIPRHQAITALGQSYQYEVKMTLRPGERKLAVAVRDEATTLTSYLARTVQVGAEAVP